MSEPDLRDLRAKVTPETAAVLDAVAEATGQDRSEIVREVLHRWAADEIRRHKVLRRTLEREGLEAPVNGTRGRRGA